MSDLPTWETDSLYRGFTDPKYHRDHRALTTAIKALAKTVQAVPAATAAGLWVEDCLVALDKIGALAENLGSFCHMLYSVDTQNAAALQELNRLEAATYPLAGIEASFLTNLRGLGTKAADLIRQAPGLKARQLTLKELFDGFKHLLSPAEEDLAADLERSGASAWSRLQSSISSELSAVWDPATGETKTVVELRSLASHPNRAIRQKAFELELAAWKTVRLPLAASLNGVKGAAVTLNTRRHWQTALEVACQQARLTPAALTAMIEVMTESLPLFRGYLRDKAQALGLPRLGFFDLFAPIGQDTTSWPYQQAAQFIVDKFGGFSSRLADFAQTAFAKNWIHPRPQPGKVGGAYCTSLPLAKQPRVLSNFDGTFGELKTLAHELGHGYHFWLLRHEPYYKQSYPMTLAETASIFCETIIFEEASKTVGGPALGFILEQQLQDVTQVIVDILSRFQFEQQVFARRAKGELTPDDFCQLMTEAQMATYGEALDPALLHPYMWAVKGHYYSAGLGFYNFPYAFGQLFSYALYGLYQQEGSPFLAKYDRLLLETGTKTADALARGLGFDLKQKDFWRRGIAVVAAQIQQFNTFVKGR